MGNVRQHHIAARHGGKIILRGPFFGIRFAVKIQNAGFECLKQHRLIGKKFDPDLIKVVGAAPQGQVFAPIIGHAAQGNKAAGLETV